MPDQRHSKTHTIRWFVIGLIAFSSAIAFADSSLPFCIDSKNDIDEIQATQKANPKSPLKYDGYRKFLATDTPLQIATRLAYAETLAANCPDQNEKIADLVTAVIGNRIRIRDSDARSVVFQRDQFSSSLNIYPESRYLDFLCPKDEALWRDISGKMHANLETPSSSIPKDAVNYYLYRHSQRFTAPDWKLEEVSIEDKKLRECIRVFRDARWR